MRSLRAPLKDKFGTDFPSLSEPVARRAVPRGEIAWVVRGLDREGRLRRPRSGRRIMAISVLLFSRHR
jgi:hypothetical protein